jgi:hypothetical protein
VLPLAAIVDTKALGDAVMWGFVAGIGVTILFTLGVVGASRFSDLRRGDRPVGALVHGVVAVLGLAGFLLTIGLGIKVMLDK